MQEKNRVGLSSNAHTVNTSQTNLNASWVPFINRGIAEFETSEHLEQQRNTACFGWKMLWDLGRQLAAKQLWTEGERSFFSKLFVHISWNKLRGLAWCCISSWNWHRIWSMAPKGNGTIFYFFFKHAPSLQMSNWELCYKSADRIVSLLLFFLQVWLLLNKLAPEPHENRNINFRWVTVRHLMVSSCIATSALS